MIRIKLIGVCALCLVSVAITAQKPDRATPPKPGPPPALKLPPIQKHKLSNGLAVWIVEQHEVPIAQVNLIIRAGSAADPVGKFGVASMTANMLDEGAGSRSALELADAIEFLGAQLGTTSSFDYSAIRLSAPVARLPDALPLMADVAVNPLFPAAELERLRKERLTRLLQARDDPEAIIEIAFPRIVFGEKHRYGTAAAGGAAGRGDGDFRVRDGDRRGGGVRRGPVQGRDERHGQRGAAGHREAGPRCGDVNGRSGRGRGRRTPGRYARHVPAAAWTGAS